MTIQEIFDLAIKMGIEADPRGKKGVERALSRAQEEYKNLPESKKDEVDPESLKHPYADTRVLYGDASSQVDKVLAGIDVDAAELVLCDRLREKGEGIDLVIAHHPAGPGLSLLDEVMDLQIDTLASYGIPVNVAESLMRTKSQEVRRRFGPINHYRSVDAARLLGIPLICLHTVWDNMGWKYVSDQVAKADIETVGDVMKVLKAIPEFTQAVKYQAGPAIYVGLEKNRAGRVAVAGFTGGTNFGKEVYERLSQAGVGTIIDMHAPEEHVEEAKKYHINLIVSGHMASDSIGANLFLDELEKQGVQVLPCSGLIRVKRKISNVKTQMSRRRQSL